VVPFEPTSSATQVVRRVDAGSQYILKVSIYGRYFISGTNRASADGDLHQGIRLSVGPPLLIPSGRRKVLSVGRPICHLVRHAPM
jgi:hypothetical protein